MSSPDPARRESDLPAITKVVPPIDPTTGDGLNVREMIEEATEQRVDAIDMMGEETAAGMTHKAATSITPGMRYLHCSRTIHQLVTDRNRAVGLFLAVASLLWTASSALQNAPDSSSQIIPMAEIKKWSMPFTFGVLTVLALLVAFLLIRTRVGLIYEAAKMNTLLGLPIGRVKRVNPLSVFFIMHVIISLAGGTSGGLFALYLLALNGMAPHVAVFPAVLIGLGISAALIILYMISVVYITSDKNLQGGVK